MIYQTIFHQTKRWISTLYVPADKAKKNFAPLQPYMNFTEIFNDPIQMEENIKTRKLNLNFLNIQKDYIKFRNIEEEKRKLENEREEIANKLKSISKLKTPADSDTIHYLRERGKTLREQLKHFKESNSYFETSFIHAYLKLPNNLDRNSPPTSDTISILYRQDLTKNLPDAEIHTNRKDLIDFENSSSYYFLNDAAVFELDFMHNCTEYFTQNAFIQMSNPDFARKILIEAACFTNKDSFYEILEEDDCDLKLNTLHLNGGGSFTSFLGFITKLSIYPSMLPLKLISSGREYFSKNNENNNQKGLFTAMQSNCVQAFIATETERQAQIEYEGTLNLIVDVYKKLNTHFQIVYESADKISSAESLRASIQMYSAHFNEYIEVGHLSKYSDYISRRILFNVKSGAKLNFPQIVGGTVVDISKIIACLIENNGSLKTSPKYVEHASSAVENFKNLFEGK